MARGIPFESLGVYAQGPYIGDKTLRDVIGVLVSPCFNEYCETGTAPHGGLCTDCERIVRESPDPPDRYDAHVQAWNYHHHVALHGRPEAFHLEADRCRNTERNLSWSRRSR